MIPTALKTKMIAMGIQTAACNGNFSVLPNTAEKSLKKKINTLAIIAINT